MTNKMHHLSWHDGVELLDVQLQGHPFGKHSHDAYAIGIMEHGTGGNVYRGERQVLPEKTLSLMNPDELHDGFSISESLKYKMIYVSEKSMRALLGINVLHGFREYAAHDTDGTTAISLNRVHTLLEQKDHVGWRLAVDSEITTMLEAVMSRHSKIDLRKKGKEPRAVSIIKNYLNDLTLTASRGSGSPPGESVTLEALAQLVDLNQNYLLNVFSQHVGISPYAYWMSRRIGAAKKLVAQGWSLSSVAQELGFYDQAHFTRAFKKAIGVTPGQLVRHP
ncbi:AraC family transcriptional regulator [Castellaniella caeni]|uniref:AraC family transcriptional regulator n=1 Tax=Castellaniella caeni TaxID=266123 RepID=UPI000C9F4C97|nr:AraC family transcriptional regulator [Castellaniella caeni]